MPRSKTRCNIRYRARGQRLPRRGVAPACQQTTFSPHVHGPVHPVLVSSSIRFRPASRHSGLHPGGRLARDLPHHHGHESSTKCQNASPSRAASRPQTGATTPMTIMAYQPGRTACIATAKPTTIPKTVPQPNRIPSSARSGCLAFMGASCRSMQFGSVPSFCQHRKSVVPRKPPGVGFHASRRSPREPAFLSLRRQSPRIVTFRVTRAARMTQP